MSTATANGKATRGRKAEVEADESLLGRRFEYTLTGISPLIMHRDGVEWADEISAWRLNAENKKKKGEQSGDDRRPAWTWTGYCYHDGEHLTVPTVNISGNFKKSAARVPYDRNRTFKELAISGIQFDGEDAKLIVGDKQVPYSAIVELREEPMFSKHVEAARSLGIELLVKRVTVGMSKHVRVRPKFLNWKLTGTIEISAPEITMGALQDIFHQAGRVGIGDWRPGAPKSPGPFGMFTSHLDQLG